MSDTHVEYQIISRRDERTSDAHVVRLNTLDGGMSSAEGDVNTKGRVIPPYIRFTKSIPHTIPITKSTQNHTSA